MKDRGGDTGGDAAAAASGAQDLVDGVAADVGQLRDLFPSDAVTGQPPQVGPDLVDVDQLDYTAVGAAAVQGPAVGAGGGRAVGAAAAAVDVGVECAVIEGVHVTSSAGRVFPGSFASVLLPGGRCGRSGTCDGARRGPTIRGVEGSGTNPTKGPRPARMTSREHQHALDSGGRTMPAGTSVGRRRRSGQVRSGSRLAPVLDELWGWVSQLLLQPWLAGRPHQDQRWHVQGGHGLPDVVGGLVDGEDEHAGARR